MKRTLILSLLLVVAAHWVGATDSLKVLKFIYDADFQMQFDNREYDASSLDESMTIFGARLRPTVGLELSPGDESTHRLVFGVDLMKDFGSNCTSIFHEFELYYSFQKRIGRTDLGIVAGVFPKSLGAEYPDLFYSDLLKFYDQNYEGLLLTFQREKAYYEVGCDWLGMYGYGTRERFLIFSHAHSQLNPWLSIGYYAYMHHYSHSVEVRNVMDNVLLNPYASASFTQWLPLQKAELTLGWQQGLQQDRAGVGHYVFPCGAELSLELRKWNVGLQNKLFVGDNMMPYYNCCDALGEVYSSSLYLGEPFYQLYYNSSSTLSLYDRVELYYQPHLCDFLDLRVSARFHFLGDGFAGSQQLVGLVFNLNKLLKP